MSIRADPRPKNLKNRSNPLYKKQTVRQAVRQAHGPEQSRRTHHPEPGRRAISKFQAPKNPPSLLKSWQQVLTWQEEFCSV